MGAIFPSVTHISKCDTFFQVWHIFLRVTHFSKCDPFFQVCLILSSVTHFSKLNLYFRGEWPIFSSDLLCKFDPYFQVWPIFPSVGHFSKCDPCHRGLKWTQRFSKYLDQNSESARLQGLDLVLGVLKYFGVLKCLNATIYCAGAHTPVLVYQVWPQLKIYQWGINKINAYLFKSLVRDIWQWSSFSLSFCWLIATLVLLYLWILLMLCVFIVRHCVLHEKSLWHKDKEQHMVRKKTSFIWRGRFKKTDTTSHVVIPLIFLTTSTWNPHVQH